MAFTPIASWAFRDKHPVGYDFVNGSSLNTCRIAVAAHNHAHPIDYVEFTFSDSVSVVDDSEVTNTSGNTYRITSKRKADIFGYGHENEYWYLDLDISAASDGSYRNISEVRVRSNSVNYDMISSGNMSARNIWISKNPTVRYLDPDAAGAGNGTSWDDAWTSLSDAITDLNSILSSQVVIRCRGTISSAGATTVWNVNHFADTFPYKVFVEDGSVIWDLTATTNSVKNLISIIGGTINLSNASSSTTLRYSNDHINMEDVIINFVNKSNTAGTNHIITNGGGGPEGHVSLINVNQNNGHSGVRILDPQGDIQENILLHGFSLDNSGTTIAGVTKKVLIENTLVTNCAGTGYTPGTHFNGYSWTSVNTVTGCNWDASEASITKTGGFSNINFDAGITIAEVSGTSYEVLSLTDDAIVIDGSISGSDILDASVTVIIYALSLEDAIIRNTLSYGNGDSGDGNGYGWGKLNAVRNVAIHNEISYNLTFAQQNLQFEGKNSNAQIVRSTLLTSDSDSQSGQRGVLFSEGRGGSLGSDDILVRHCITPNLSATGTAISASSNVVLGPNILLIQSGGLLQDGSVRAESFELSSLSLSDLSSVPPDFSPTSSTLLILDESDSDFDDVLYDAEGVELIRDGTGAIGALSFTQEDTEGNARTLDISIAPQHQRPPSFTLNGNAYPSRSVDLRIEEMIESPQLDGPVTVRFENVDPDYEIRYTTSNRNPSNNSLLYSGPIMVIRNLTGSDNTVIKARIYHKENPNITTRIIKIQFRLY